MNTSLASQEELRTRREFKASSLFVFVTKYLELASIASSKTALPLQRSILKSKPDQHKKGHHLQRAASGVHYWVGVETCPRNVMK